MTKSYDWQKGLYSFPETFAASDGYLDPARQEEKYQIAYVWAVVASALAEQGVIFGKNRPLHLVEPGIGDGSSTRKYIEAFATAHKKGFVVHGSDVLSPRLRALAEDNLEKIPGVRVADNCIFHKDAFMPTALSHVPGDLFVASHMIYHAHKNAETAGRRSPEETQSRVDTFVRNAMDALREDGLALMVHETSKSDLSPGIGKFGTGMPDAAGSLMRAARKLGLRVATLDLEPKLFFPEVSEKSLRDFEKLENWKNFEDGSPEAGWLKKFLFSLCAPQSKPVQEGGPINGALLLEKEGAFLEALHATRGILEKNASGLTADDWTPASHGGFIVVRAQMQGFLKSDEHRTQLANAFERARTAMHEIMCLTHWAMDGAGANPLPAPLAQAAYGRKIGINAKLH